MIVEQMINQDELYFSDQLSSIQKFSLNMNLFNTNNIYILSVSAFKLLRKHCLIEKRTFSNVLAQTSLSEEMKREDELGAGPPRKFFS